MEENQKNLRIPLNGCSALFEKLKFDFEELKQGPVEYKAFNFVITAYHLYQDWINAVGSTSAKIKKDNLPDSAKCLFNVWRDITNATKHWELNNSSLRRKVVEDVSNPVIADWHAYFISGPVIYVSVSGREISLSTLAEITIDCFEWILNDSKSVFPEELKSSIKILDK